MKLKKWIFIIVLSIVSFLILYFTGKVIVENGIEHKSVWKGRIKDPDMGTEDGIDINSAEMEDFMRIHGFGEVYSENIIRHREELGGFKGMQDLLGAEKIGEKRLEVLKKYFKIDKEK